MLRRIALCFFLFSAFYSVFSYAKEKNYKPFLNKEMKDVFLDFFGKDSEPFFKNKNCIIRLTNGSKFACGSAIPEGLFCDLLVETNKIALETGSVFLTIEKEHESGFEKLVNKIHRNKYQPKSAKISLGCFAKNRGKFNDLYKACTQHHESVIQSPVDTNKFTDKITKITNQNILKKHENLACTKDIKTSSQTQIDKEYANEAEIYQGRANQKSKSSFVPPLAAPGEVPHKDSGVPLRVRNNPTN